MDEKDCPVCKTRMKKQGNIWFCPACGFEIRKKRKVNYRTKRDIQENMK